MATSTRALTSKQSEQVRAAMRLIRDELGSDTLAARECKFSQGHYNRILHGDSVGYQIAEKVARYLGVPVEILLSQDTAELVRALRHNPKRWGAPTIAWAGKAAEMIDDERSEAQWVETLDEAERQFRKLLRTPPTKRP